MGRLAPAFLTTPTRTPTINPVTPPAMNSTARRRRQVANPEAVYKVRLPDGTMATFATFERALAVAYAITGANVMRYRETQPGYILIP